MAKFEIVDTDGKVLFSGEFESIRECVEKAVFGRVKLVGANLEGANLSGANLREANLSRADLEGANLWVARLAGANLVGAYLYRANLEGANLAGAVGLTVLTVLLQAVRSGPGVWTLRFG